jgi:hypothetical protein
MVGNYEVLLIFFFNERETIVQLTALSGAVFLLATINTEPFLAEFDFPSYIFLKCALALYENSCSHIIRGST